ncbi:retrovirus-related pol polyprotein from transposon TNT 1-94 [Tanacetum coccineum]|uniref:Retrovirus-related pol polyprotein from transposon TNT 1-94 n=1 Tax=Tanacetum coccineum TaxID=301880 RepID=A0ABQ5F8W3_9ASTR
MDELIAHVFEKTYAYDAIRTENQNLLFTISELKTRLANAEKGMFVNTKFDKTNASQPLLCVAPLNKHVIQKKTNVQKSKENHVMSKPVTLQTSPAKQSGVNSNKNVIAPGMYKVVTTHESQTNEAKHDLSSTGMNAASSVRRPMNRDSHVKNSVLANSKKPAKKVAVYVRKNKQTDITSENVISNKENVIDVDVANASKAKTLLCVSCMQNVLIPCHDNCFANYKLNVHSNVRRTLSTKSRTPKSYDTTYVVHKTRFSKESTLSKSLDTTYVVSKPKIDVGSTSKANDKVSSTKKRNLRDKSLSTYMKNKIRTSRIWQKWFESKPNVVWSPVNTKPNDQNSIQNVLWIVGSGCSKAYEAEEGIDFDESSAHCFRIIPRYVLHVYRLKKDLYGLRQAPRAWYDRLSSFLIEHGFTKGGLMYLTASRLDIAFATFICARYQARPTVKHLKEVKRIFWYLRQSYNMGLWYLKNSGFELIAYSDANHAGCKDDCKSTSGGLQFLVVWMRTQLLDYGYKYSRILMYCDSKSAIAISCNPVQHSKTKHIDIRYHFIKEHVEKGTVEIYFVGTEYQLADLFTKALPKERFEYLVHRIVDVHPDELCPPNKLYDLMDANKKVDLDHVQCLPESKILTNIIKNHPLRFSIVASSSVP